VKKSNSVGKGGVKGKPKHTGPKTGLVRKITVKKEKRGSGGEKVVQKRDKRPSKINLNSEDAQRRKLNKNKQDGRGAKRQIESEVPTLPMIRNIVYSRKIKPGLKRKDQGKGKSKSTLKGVIATEENQK